MNEQTRDRPLALRCGSWAMGSGMGMVAVLVAFGLAYGIEERADDPEVEGVDAPTFTADVAPILQASCQTCHRPEGMGPMSLMTYDEVRPWAPVIREQVAARNMPPWHVDRTVGITEFKNDVSLSEEEIATIVEWVDAGAPEGDPADMPEPVAWPDADDWQLPQERPDEFGPPDLVLRSPPYTVAPDGMDQWWMPTTEFEGLERERYLRAAEFKPAYPLGLRVVHHGHATLIHGGGATGVARYGVGKSWEVYPDGVGMRVAPEGRISWNLHYFPIGEVVEDDVVEIGLWFYPEGEEPEIETAGEVLFRVDRMGGMPRGGDILIPPHGYQTLQGVHVLDRPAVIHSYRPHMHMRGKVMSMEAIYPDGRREMLGKVSNYDHNWQLSYIYEDHVAPLLPAGTVLLFTSVFDNTANNPINPDPDQWVAFDRRGVGEMSHMWVGITYLDEEDFERMVTQRQEELERLELAEAEDDE